MSNQTFPNSPALPEDIRPCEHMVNLVSRRSDNTLSGPAKLYTDFHILTCPHCRAALEGLRALQSRVAALSTQTIPTDLRLTESEWETIEKTWIAGDGRS